MINTENLFYGQQQDEKILYVAKPHPIYVIFNLIKVYFITFIIFIIFLFISREFGGVSSLFYILGIIVPTLILIIGTKIVSNFYKRNLSYITDRRIVRFDPTTFFATNIRSLSWDEAVKVKTFAPNMLWKQLKIGTVVIHARTSVKTIAEELNHSAAADDIEINDVYLYRDLGNYIDKILFTYKQMPSGMNEIRPFVEKPKGLRY